jgi:hypothetical protein
VKLSRYFHDLRSAYQAELDDLVSDSEGKDVLRKRLTEKRKEFGFLVQMMELAPELVAVVFHRGFRFLRPAALEQLVGLPLERLSPWSSLQSAVVLEPWAQPLLQAVLREPAGERFMSIAAGLEYLYHHADAMGSSAAAHGADGDSDGEGNEEQDALEHDDGYNALSADDAIEPHNSRTRDEASANWLADAGFDRKE